MQHGLDMINEQELKQCLILYSVSHDDDTLNNVNHCHLIECSSILFSLINSIETIDPIVFFFSRMIDDKHCLMLTYGQIRVDVCRESMHYLCVFLCQLYFYWTICLFLRNRSCLDRSLNLHVYSSIHSLNFVIHSITFLDLTFHSIEHVYSSNRNSFGSTSLLPFARRCLT
jgi:hypothetical protein